MNTTHKTLLFKKKSKPRKKPLLDKQFETWDNYGWEENLPKMVSLILSRYKEKKNKDEI